MAPRRRRIRPDQLADRPRRVDVPPYTVLARYYDDVMDHVDYRNWARYAVQLAQFHRAPGNRLVELACGTGSLAREFTGHGFDVEGFDGCAEMIAVARRRKAKRGRLLRFGVSDLRERPGVESPADLAVCLYDSLNYLLEREDLQRHFRAVHSVLRSGGIYIYDLSTEHNSVTNFDGYALEEKVRGGAYRRITRYDPEERVQHNIFDIYPDDEPEVVYLEHHRQRIWAEEELRILAERAGFLHRFSYHEQTMRAASSISDRVHIVLEAG